MIRYLVVLQHMSSMADDKDRTARPESDYLVTSSWPFMHVRCQGWQWKSDSIVKLGWISVLGRVSKYKARERFVNRPSFLS